jgi:mercuric reductase
MSDCCSNGSGSYDLAVVGAGSAGFSAAITAAEDGARVALIGHGIIGGTCVIVGCVPSKTMIRALEVMHAPRAAARFDGIEAEARITDWGAVIRQEQALVDDLPTAKYIDVLPQHNGIAYLDGAASFAEGGKLTVNGDPLTTGKLILATGSRPHVPNIPGIAGVRHHDSTSTLELTELPNSLIVMGGGYIGVELAHVFARAGAEVTIVTRRGLLPEAGPEIGEALTHAFEVEGIAFRTVQSYTRVARQGHAIALTVDTGDGPRVIGAEELLLATGRVPNTAHLALDLAGIETGARGGIVVDDRMRTSRQGVCVAGDVTGRDQFVYMAAYGARLAAKNEMNGDSLVYDNTAMPAVVFSDPQVASVGLTEAAARAAGHDVRTSVLPLDAVPRALAARDTRGLIKLVADGPSKRLLGAHILAPEGADSIQTAAMALKAGMTYEELGDMIFPYLTTVEGLKLAAQTFDKDVAALAAAGEAGVRAEDLPRPRRNAARLHLALGAPDPCDAGSDRSVASGEDLDRGRGADLDGRHLPLERAALRPPALLLDRSVLPAHDALRSRPWLRLRFSRRRGLEIAGPRHRRRRDGDHRPHRTQRQVFFSHRPAETSALVRISEIVLTFQPLHRASWRSRRTGVIPWT